MRRNHVLVEKPIGVSVGECRVRDAARDSGLVLQVGTEKRLDPGIAFARCFVQEEIGETLATETWYCDWVYRYSATNALQSIIRPR